MATWDEIRDEVAGMLADGKPLEDVLAKLEKRKNEMAKANLLKAMDDMKKQKQTNEDWLRSATLEELAGTIYEWYSQGHIEGKFGKQLSSATRVVEWLKEKHE